MLDTDLKNQLQAYLEKVTRPIEIVASLDDSAKSREMQELLGEIVLLSDKITLVERHDADVHTPSFALNSPGHDIHLRFAGLPMGHEFTSLVLALLQVGGHPSRTAQDVIEQIKSLDGEYKFETYFSLSCQNCPDVVQALNLMAVLNPNIQHVAIDGALRGEVHAAVATTDTVAVAAATTATAPIAEGEEERASSTVSAASSVTEKLL